MTDIKQGLQYLLLALIGFFLSLLGGMALLLRESKKPLLANDEAGQCNAVTRNGTPCQRQVDKGDDFCWQHKTTVN